jgi:hypothetical protein
MLEKHYIKTLCVAPGAKAADRRFPFQRISALIAAPRHGLNF